MASGLCLWLGWFVLTDQRVPLVGPMMFFVHEAGHLLTMFWAPQLLVAAAGSLMQLLIPTVFLTHFIVREPDHVGGIVCASWLATQLADVARYVRDADDRLLPLAWEGATHDWWFILGADGRQWLHMADAFGGLLRATAFLVMAGAVSWLWVWPWLSDDNR